jgi:hypothetical protein
MPSPQKSATAGSARTAKRNRVETPEVKEIVRTGGWSIGSLFLDPETFLAKKEKRPAKLNFLELEELTADSQVAAALAMIVMPTLALKYRITIADERKQKDRPLTKNVTRALDKIYPDLLGSMMTALPYGFSAMEKRWYYTRDGWWWWKPFLQCPPRQTWIRRNQNDFDGFAQGLQDKVDNPKVEADKAFIFTNDKNFVFGNMYGRPRTWAAVRPAWIKKHIERFASVYYEQSAQPMKEGRAPTRATRIDGNGVPTVIDGQLWLKEEVIDKIAAGATGYTLPADRDERGNFIWDIINKELQKTGMDWTEFMRYLDVSIGRGMLIPDLTGFQNAQDTGSKAMSQQHGSVFWTMQTGLFANIRWHFNTYLLPQFMAYNYGPNAPEATWDYEPLSPEIVTWLQSTVDRQIAAGRVEVDVEELSDRLGIGIEKIEQVPGLGPIKPTNIPEDGKKNTPK